MKEPPIAKVYEAFTAIASGRVEMKEEEAIVRSSNDEKKYQVTWYQNQYSSTDNASFWQGYPGYPIIAVLLLKKELLFHEEVATLVKDVNWHDLNKQYQRNYDKAIQEVLENLSEENRELLEKTAKEVYQQLLQLKIEVVRKVKKP